MELKIENQKVSARGRASVLFQIQLKPLLCEIFFLTKDSKAQKYEKLSLSSQRGHQDFAGTHSMQRCFKCVSVCNVLGNRVGYRT